MITSVSLSHGGRELSEIWMAHDWHMIRVWNIGARGGCLAGFRYGEAKCMLPARNRVVARDQAGWVLDAPLGHTLWVLVA